MCVKGSHDLEDQTALWVQSKRGGVSWDVRISWQGQEDLPLDMDCSGLQCVLEDPTVLGCQAVFKRS